MFNWFHFISFLIEFYCGKRNHKVSISGRINEISVDLLPSGLGPVMIANFDDTEFPSGFPLK